ncbi:hypothetical protein [Mangrovihabitans endophyticus]|uniref:Uncharacterized protein n=1 Tax=Mangrovihabitans endophyticus TaxID=1751298 RepID=A0A8J3BWD6_9ACTN|nr:hypothetical protein [Mangrovihabitans endophyticus]GGK82888.1 hypothetical protein GCM10012284_16220 [Mangrovihabitans endophyticus]
MPTRVLLEGPAIEPLLAQVRDEYGAGVRIISADKVRTGGIGGFFAKQHYELSVEVPDPGEERKAPPRKPASRPVAPGAAAARGAASGPSSLEQLLERAESRDRIAPEERPAVGNGRPGLATPPPSGMPEPARSGAGPRHGAGPRLSGAPELQSSREAGMRDAEAAADDNELNGLAEIGEPAGHPRIADPGAAFAELMAGLDTANQIATAGSIRSAPRPADTSERDDVPTVRPFRPAQATGSPVNGEKGRGLSPVPSLADLMGGLGVSEDDIPPFQPQKPLPTPARSAAAAYGLRTPPPAAPTSPARPGSADLAVPEPAAQVPALRPTPSDSVITNLISVGMPETMAEQITGGDTYAAVLTAMAARPAAPGIPDGPGEVLVLAGELSHAVPMAKQLLAQAGLDQNRLLLAGPSASGTGLHSSRIMHTPEAAAARAEKLQASDKPWIVLMDTPVGATNPVAINDMCDALGATALWAVVDATRKTNDTARHLRMLGEVEALVVHGIELTSDPATVLGLDLPIFSMDGKPATPHAWAALLCARIAADIAPVQAPARRQARSAR